MTNDEIQVKATEMYAECCGGREIVIGEVDDPDCEGGAWVTARVYENQANFKTRTAAERYIARMRD